MSILDDNYGLDTSFNFDPEAYGNELIAGASDLTDEERATLAAALKKPSIAAKLKNSVALRSDAQRKLDQARSAAQEAVQVRDANFRWKSENVDPIEQWKRDQAAQAARNAGGGNGNGGGGDQRPNITGLSLEAVEKLLADRDAKILQTLQNQDESYIGVLADTVDLTETYREMFSARLPYRELQKFALDKRMSLANAFPLFIAPKLEEKRKGEIETIKKQAFEEGKLAAMSERDEPGAGEAGGDLGSAFKDSLLGRRSSQRLTDAGGKELTGEDAFVASWNRSKGFTQVEKSH